jgi:hypothetical protein
MPKAILLKDGSVLRAPGDIPDEAFDPIADAVEMGKNPPPGFALEKARKDAAPGYQGSQIYQDLAGPAATVRDTTTEAVRQATQNVAAMAPEAMSLQDKLQQAGVPRETASRMVAKQIVPQTPDQLVSALALGALGPIEGVTASFLRMVVPTALGMATKRAMNEAQDPITILAQIVGSVVGEGNGPALQQIMKRKPLVVMQDPVGDEFAKIIGEATAQVSSVKHLKTPESFRMMLGDKTARESLFAAEASKAMEEAEKGISQALVPTMAQLPTAQRQSAQQMLEYAAGFKNQLEGEIRPRPLSGVVTPVRPPDVLLKEALDKKRDLWQQADAAVGHDHYELMKLHTAQSEKIRSSLAAIDPALADRYTGMNTQFANDMEMLDNLWRMKEAGAWTSGADRQHFNAGEAASVLADMMKSSQKTKFMGGPEGVTQFLSGPSGVPGAMPTTHEGVVRMFMQLLPGMTSLSGGAKTKSLMVPVAPVMASHVRALADYLGSSTLRSMLTPETTPQPGMP